MALQVGQSYKVSLNGSLCQFLHTYSQQLCGFVDLTTAVDISPDSYRMSSNQRHDDLPAKPMATHVETSDIETDQPARLQEEYGHTKSSKEEIRLVRKLDCFIMPTLWIMW